VTAYAPVAELASVLVGTARLAASCAACGIARRGVVTSTRSVPLLVGAGRVDLEPRVAFRARRVRAEIGAERGGP
jgi:hypothetical protein